MEGQKTGGWLVAFLLDGPLIARSPLSEKHRLHDYGARPLYWCCAFQVWVWIGLPFAIF